MIVSRHSQPINGAPAVPVLRPLPRPASVAREAATRTPRWRGTLALPYWLAAVFLTLVLGLGGVLGWIVLARPAAAPPTVTRIVEPPPPPAGGDEVARQIEQMTADLERAQRDSVLLHSLAQQQALDLNQTQAELQTSQQDRAAQLGDVQARLQSLEQQLDAIEQLAERMRSMLGLPASAGPSGGPAGDAPPSPADPASRLMSDIGQAQQRVASVTSSLEEINSVAQKRLAAARSSGLAGGAIPANDLAFAPYVPRGQPVTGPISSGFGARDNPFVAPSGDGVGGTPAAEFHTGKDIVVPQGTAVHATGPGTVTIAGPYGGYGNLVVIDHGHGITTYYGHNSSISVAVGDHVEAGQVIALSGSTGRSTGPHVHYEVRVNNVPVDPTPYMTLAP